jgi:hypothetical protein
MSKNKTIILMVIALIAVSSYVYLIKQPKKCSYKLSRADVHGVSFNQYTLADYYNGTIKNVSGRTEFLRGMILKFYDADNILIQEGYQPVNKNIISGTGIPYSVNVQFGSEEQRAKLRSSRVDLYPWFSTCQ